MLGTHQDNMKDMVAKNRQNHIGHEWSPYKNPELRRGENSHYCVLTSEQVAEIRKEYKRWGYHYSNKRQLAAKYRVSETTIKRIVSGRARKYDGQI